LWPGLFLTLLHLPSSNFDSVQSAYRKRCCHWDRTIEGHEQHLWSFWQSPVPILVTQHQSAALDCIDHWTMVHQLNYTWFCTWLVQLIFSLMIFIHPVAWYHGVPSGMLAVNTWSTTGLVTRATVSLSLHCATVWSSTFTRCSLSPMCWQHANLRICI